jgi:hypothetical protein
MSKRKHIQHVDYALELTKAFEYWADLYENGGSDPNWADGVNINLIRNHILNFKSMIRETMQPENYPGIYHKPEPPIVNNNYMAHADEIRRDAEHTLKLYLNDANYRFLRDRADFLSAADREETYIDAMLGYCAGLERAIKDGDLVTMRRHRNAASRLSAFAECAAQVRAISPERLRSFQMCLI